MPKAKLSRYFIFESSIICDEICFFFDAPWTVYQKSADKKTNQIPNQQFEEISDHGAESELKLFKGIYKVILYIDVTNVQYFFDALCSKDMFLYKICFNTH